MLSRAQQLKGAAPAEAAAARLARPLRPQHARAVCVRVRSASGGAPDKGLSLLEWSSKLAPQGMLVTGESRHRPAVCEGGGRTVCVGAQLACVRRALGVCERSQAPAHTPPPPPLLKGAKTGWRLAWQAMVRELAPQDKGGGYSRPRYAFDGRLGSPEFPVSASGARRWSGGSIERR